MRLKEIDSKQRCPNGTCNDNDETYTPLRGRTSVERGSEIWYVMHDLLDTSVNCRLYTK